MGIFTTAKLQRKTNTDCITNYSCILTILPYIISLALLNTNGCVPSLEHPRVSKVCNSATCSCVGLGRPAPHVVNIYSFCHRGSQLLHVFNAKSHQDTSHRTLTDYRHNYRDSHTRSNSIHKCGSYLYCMYILRTFTVHTKIPVCMSYYHNRYSEHQFVHHIPTHTSCVWHIGAVSRCTCGLNGKCM